MYSPHMLPLSHALDAGCSPSSVFPLPSSVQVQAVRAQQGSLLTQLREAEKSWLAERKVLTQQLRGVGHAAAGPAASPSRRASKPSIAQATGS